MYLMQKTLNCFNEIEKYLNSEVNHIETGSESIKGPVGKLLEQNKNIRSAPHRKYKS